DFSTTSHPAYPMKTVAAFGFQTEFMPAFPSYRQIWIGARSVLRFLCAWLACVLPGYGQGAHQPDPQTPAADLVRAMQSSWNSPTKDASLCKVIAQMAEAAASGQSVGDFIRGLIVKERVPAILVESFSNCLT